jgi:hypothetical protein
LGVQTLKTVHFSACVLFCSAVSLTFGQSNSSKNIHELMKEANTALAENRLHDASQLFQNVIDLNPSSAKGHEGLGIALSRELMAGNVRPSADSDVVERAEDHLQQASSLSPSSVAPLLLLSEFESALGERASDPTERSDRYSLAQSLLKRVLSMEPAKADLYLRLANVERDQFGPVLQQAKSHFKSSDSGPLPDSDVRHSLQEQYGELIDDAIANAKTAAQLDTHSPRSLLLTARLLRERALLRDSAEQYATDMNEANDWQRQFLAVGSHLDDRNTFK